MDKKYITLFKELAQATAASAETVMDYDREKGDQKGLDTATIMRDDYQALAESLDEEYQINKSDTAKLLVGAMIITNQLQDRINSLKKAITGYQTDVIPKLQKIVDEAKSDEEVTKMVNKLFIIEDK